MDRELPETITDKVRGYHEQSANARRCVDVVTEGEPRHGGAHWPEGAVADFSGKGSSYTFMHGVGGLKAVVHGTLDTADEVVTALQRERQVLLEQIADLERKWEHGRG